MVFNQFFALCLTLYTSDNNFSFTLNIFSFCRMCVDINFIVSSIHKYTLRRGKIYFLAFIDFFLLEFFFSVFSRKYFFMAEYMLYLSHNTISYHFDITQMLISSALYSSSFFDDFNTFSFSQINLLLHINFYVAFICCHFWLKNFSAFISR